jgi:hypothetical protein
MARGNRSGKKGGWAGAGGANTDKKGQKSDGTTSYKQKAFGKGQLIDRVFKESNVLRDTSGKFIDKPGRGKPPKARVLDGHRPGETEQKKFKQMQDVSKSVKAREKSAKELDEYRLNLARESIKQEILTKVNSSARLATVANSKQVKSLEELIQARKTDLEINSDYDKLKSEYSDRQVKAYTESLLLQGVSDKEISAKVTLFKQGILEVNQSDSSLEIQGLLKTIALAEGINDSSENIIKEYKRLNKELNEETIRRAMSMADGEDTVRDEYLFYRAREERRKALTTLSSTIEERDTSKEAVGKRKEETSSSFQNKKQLSDELKKLKLELKGDKSEEAKEKLKKAKSRLDEANELYKGKKEDSDKDKGSNELKTLGFRDITEVKREGFIGDTTKRARVITPGTEETIAKRISSLEDIYGKKTLNALMENMDVVSVSPKNMNIIQANLIDSLYSVRQRNNTLNEDMKLITWGNLSKDLSQDEINSFIGGWARKQEIKNYIGNANWSNKKATEGSIYTNDKRNKAGEKLVSSWAKEGNYSRNSREEPETKELASKVHNYIKGGMRKNYKNAVDKAVTEATEAARNQGTPLSDAEIKEITREAKKEAMVKLINMEEILNGEADVEKFQGRVIVNPATELPREIIKNLPDGALNYLISKYENQVGRKVKTSVVYNELLHGNFEEDVSQKDSSRIKFETHHIEQFMHRTESGEPVIVYDSFKSGGKLRTMIHSDMDNLYAEEVEGELLYYVKSKKGTSEVKSYLARSPYEDETGVEIREDGRVLKDGKESVSPIKEELGTNEPYIDLRGSTHQNKEFLYSMLHPGTTLKNDDKLSEQINSIERIANITGNKPVSSLYKDKDIKFFSMGVGAEERKSHERLKSKLEAIRKLETLNELRRERENRREVNPEGIAQQEKLANFGHAERLKKSEEQNVKSVSNRVDDLLLLKAAYNAFDAPQSTKDRLGKLLDKTITQAAKAKGRLIDVDNKIEELETNYGDLIKTKFDARVHSEKFLEEAMYEANTWGIPIEGKITENRMREAIIKNGKS